MVLLYWDIGRIILERQRRSGWGAKIIDRLAGDLRDAYPDMKGLAPHVICARGACTIAQSGQVAQQARTYFKLRLE
ncbi:MAG: DUF1016 N-terminal domain-containing protein [Steroidobacteraceae bacterium]